MKNKAFTLLELVVVIVILGVLATLGFTQYGRMVERSRWAEAKMILGDMRKLAFVYWLANGTLTGITNSNLNVGTAADQIPSACRSSHYFYYDYYTDAYWVLPWVLVRAWRCSSGGKEPNASNIGPLNELEFAFTLDGSAPDQWCKGPALKGNCYSGSW